MCCHKISRCSLPLDDVKLPVDLVSIVLIYYKGRLHVGIDFVLIDQCASLNKCLFMLDRASLLSCDSASDMPICLASSFCAVQK